MPNEPPYFPFYPTDFTSDDKVEAMSTLAVGAYTLLLCKAWQQDPPGSIPDEDERLAKWARVSLKMWRKIKPEVVAAFQMADNRWVQKRMTAEYKKATDLILRRSAAGRSGAAQRHGKGMANAEQSDGNRITNASDCSSTCGGAPARPRASGSLSGSDSSGDSSSGGAGGAVMPPTLAASPEFVIAWATYVRHRSERGDRPMGPSAVEAQWMRLLGWGLERAVMALRHTVANDWKNIREPDSDHGHPSGNGKAGGGTSGLARHIAAQAERDSRVCGPKPKFPGE